MRRAILAVVAAGLACAAWAAPSIDAGDRQDRQGRAKLQSKTGDPLRDRANQNRLKPKSFGSFGDAGADPVRARFAGKNGPKSVAGKAGPAKGKAVNAAPAGKK